MSRHDLIRKMNRYPKVSFWIVALTGYLLHLLYEVLAHIHAGKPMTVAEFLWMAGLSAIVWVGAGVAGWGVDLMFTKGEKDAGELD